MSVHLACAEHKEPDSDSDIIYLAISQPKQLQNCPLTNGPLLPVPAYENPISTLNNPITKEIQQTAAAHYFGIPLIAAATT